MGAELRPQGPALASVSMTSLLVASIAVAGFDTEAAAADSMPEQRYERPQPDFEPASVPQPRWYSERTPEGRRLRGDWEGSELVVLTFTDVWRAPSLQIGDLVAQYLAAGTSLWLLHDSDEARVAAQHAASRWRNDFGIEVTLFERSVDTPWIRDYGPLAVHGPLGAMEWVDANYGGSRPADDGIWRASGQPWALPMVETSMPFEGGAIASNGRGLCVSTLEFFALSGLWPLGQLSDDEPTPAELLGCPHLLLVPALRSDDTAHADMFMQFMAPDHVWLAQVDPREDPEDALRLELAHDALLEAAQSIGVELKVTRTRMPRLGDQSYYTSYVNALRVDDLLVVPSFASVPPDRDLKIRDQIAHEFPDLTVVSVAAESMARLGGAVHCMALGLDWPAP